MATNTFTYTANASTSGSVKTNLYLYFSVSDINSAILSALASYNFSAVTIKSCTLKWNFQRATAIASSSDGYYYIYRGSDEDNLGTQLYKYNVTNNTTHSGSIDLTSLVYTNNGALLSSFGDNLIFWSSYYYTWEQTVSADIEVVWEFEGTYEVDKINNIYAGTTSPTVYVGTTQNEVKVYIGVTKIYE